MKKLIFSYIFLIISSISLFGQITNFKYEGEIPKEKYVVINLTNHFEKSNVFLKENSDSVKIRNRVYVNIDSLGRLRLNNHLSSIGSLAKDLKYIVTNPNKEVHLPKSSSDAVIFINFTKIDKTLEEDKVLTYKQEYIFLTISSIYIRLKQDYLEHKLNKTWEQLNEEDLATLEQEFKFNLAMPKNAFGVDKQLLAELEETETPDLNQTEPQNFLKIAINEHEQVIIDGKETQITDLKSIIKLFITNPEKRKNLAETPTKAVILFTATRETSYELYLTVYNEIKTVYKELWEETAQRLFDKNYEHLSTNKKRAIRTIIPIVIIEN